MCCSSFSGFIHIVVVVEFPRRSCRASFIVQALFKLLFAMQSKSHGQAKFQGVRNKLYFLVGGAKKSHCQRVWIQGKEELELFCNQSTKSNLLIFLSGSSPWPNTGFFPVLVNNYFSLSHYLRLTPIPCGLARQVWFVPLLFLVYKCKTWVSAK